MKRAISFILFLCMTFCMCPVSFAAQEDVLHIDYKEYDGVLLNIAKGMAYTTYTTTPELPGDAMDFVSTIYTRNTWADNEPEEGKFDWSYYDDLLKWCEENDKYLQLGVMTLTVKDGYSTPKFVFDAGAYGVECLTGYNVNNNGIIPGRENEGTGTTWVPDYKDPIWQEKYNNFVKALGERYDGHPRLAAVYMLSEGTYGEGGYARMYGKGVPLPTFPENSWEVFYKPYQEAFTETPLMMERVHNQLEIVDHGIGVKRNGLMEGDDLAAKIRRMTKGELPVQMEFYTSYPNMKDAGNIGYPWYPDMYMWYHQLANATFGCSDIGVGGEFFTENYDMVKLTADYVGYRWTIRSMEIPETFNSGDEISLKINIENTGMAKNHKGGVVKVALLDNNDNVIYEKWMDDINPKDWREFTAYDLNLPIKLDNISDGSYKLAFTIHHYKDSVGLYNLYNYDKTQNGYYILADITKNGNKFNVKRHTSDETITLCAGKTELGKNCVITKAGSYLVPLRKTCEGLGINVEYNEFDNSLRVYKDNKEYKLKFNSNLAEIKGASSIVLKDNLISIGDTGYILSDDLAKLFAVDISFDESKRNLIFNLPDTDLINKKPYEDRFEKIEDGGFEAGNNIWSYDTSAFSITDEDAFEGKYSLKMTNSAPYDEFNRKKAYQTIMLDEEKLYKVTYKTKGDAMVKCKIFGNWDEPIEACCSEPSNEWAENTLYFKIKDTFFRNSKDPYASITFETTGKDGSVAYIDDVKIFTDPIANLAEKNKDGIEVVLNGNFENDGREWFAFYDAKVDYIEENPHSGAGCAMLNYIGPNWGSLKTFFTNEMIEAGPGRYKFSCWVRSDKPDTEMYYTIASIRPTQTISESPYAFTKKIGTEWQQVVWEGNIDWENSGNEELNREMQILAGLAIQKKQDAKVYIDDITLKKVGELTEAPTSGNLFEYYEPTKDYGFDTNVFDQYKSGPMVNWRVDDFEFEIDENGYNKNALSVKINNQKGSACIGDAWWQDTGINQKLFGLQKDQKYRLSFKAKLKNGKQASQEQADFLMLKGGKLQLLDNSVINFADKVGKEWVEISADVICTYEPRNDKDKQFSFFSLWTNSNSSLNGNVYLFDEFKIEPIK